MGSRDTKYDQTLSLTYQIYNSTPIVTELYAYLTHIQQLDVRSGAAAGGGRASPPCPMESTGEPNTASPKFCETVRVEVIDCQSSSHPKSLHVISSKEQETLLQIWPFVPVPNWLLSRFWNRDKASGTKASRGFCPGWKNRDKRCLTLKKILLTTGFDPKTSCSTHGFLANSPK